MDLRLQEENGHGVLIFIAVMNMLSKPRRFGPLLSADLRMQNLSKFKQFRRIRRKAHRGSQRYGSIGPSIANVKQIEDTHDYSNTRTNRSIPSWPTMCFSSYSSEPFELRQILHLHKRKGTKPTFCSHCLVGYLGVA